MAIRDSREKYNAYMRKKHLERYHRLRKEAIDQLGGCCVGCGSRENLELDHIDPKSKSFEVSKFLSVSLEDFRKELKKCQLLCRKCHVKKTLKEQGKLPTGTHGTLSTYSHGKCRCQKCKDTWNAYSRKYKREWRKRKRLIS